MRKFGLIISIAVIAGALIAPKVKADSSRDYFDITKVTFEEITDSAQDLYPFDQPGLSQDCNPSPRKPNIKYSDEVGTDPLTDWTVVVDQIINAGKKIWQIVEAGKPVANLSLNTANALPRGLGCWMDLQEWKAPESRVYRVQYANAFGANVVSFAFRVNFTHGGALDGIGKYVTNATIMPAALDVSWGFTFNADVSVPSVVNMGTKKNPVGAVQLVVNWQVDSPVKKIRQSETFFMSGDGKLTHLD